MFYYGSHGQDSIGIDCSQIARGIEQGVLAFPKEK
jgi:hypothetical protein